MVSIAGIDGFFEFVYVVVFIGDGVAVAIGLGKKVPRQIVGIFGAIAVVYFFIVG
jgi:hypothetical protein